jgi:hypothetical protein
MNDLPEDLALVRSTYGVFKLATADFAEACYLAQQNKRSQRAIASAAGCSQMTVSYVLKAREQSLFNGEPFSEVFTSITNTSRKPSPKDSGDGKPHMTYEEARALTDQIKERLAEMPLESRREIIALIVSYDRVAQIIECEAKADELSAEAEALRKHAAELQNVL